MIGPCSDCFNCIYKYTQCDLMISAGLRSRQTLRLQLSSEMELPQMYPWSVATLLIISILADCNQSFNFGGLEHVGPTQFVTKKAEPKRRPNLKTVLVKCHEDSLEVVVNGDLFDIGILVNSSDLHLGSKSSSSEAAHYSCAAAQTGEAEFTILSHLDACGTTLSFTETALVYSNVLVYSPSPPHDGIHRLDAASIPVECHYGKQYAVDSAPLVPMWIPLVSTITAKDQLDFSLRLMTDDWRSERTSNNFVLGDVIHLEATVVMHKHMPLRVYVDHCVATDSPDAESSLRHDFIDYYGCLVDGQLTGSGSRYMPRVQNDKLNIMLDAFRFFQAQSDVVYITCQLKAVPAVNVVDSRNRACSFIVNRWRSADGNDQACKSCEVSQRFAKFNAQPTTTLLTPTTLLTTTTPPTKPKPYPASFFRKARPASRRPSPSGWKRRVDTTHEWRNSVTMGPLVIVPAQEVTTLETDSTTLPPETIPVENGGLEAVHRK